jgi:TPP-dependent trihydroxycyclohexane-1,2-dione (THcHDO) dehydratase
LLAHVVNRDDCDHLRQEAQRARWWAISVSDPVDRERIEAAAREYEELARDAERRSREDLA